MPMLYIPEKWDGESDVIVVGAGNAGLPAAITVKNKGAGVIVLETWSGSASSLAMIAGGVLFAGTPFQKEKGIDDSPEKMYQEALEISKGDPALWGVIRDRTVDTFNWVMSLEGVELVSLFMAPAHGEQRLHRFKGHGAGLLKAMRETASKKGINILYKHRAERLLQDPATGRVKGVRAKHDDKVIHFKAKKAVVIATGGFFSNPEYVKEFGPNYTQCVPAAPPTHRGDGLRMAMQIGAGTTDIGLSVCPSIPICTTTNRTIILWEQGAIDVNEEGRRWADEIGVPYSIRNAELLREHPDGLHFLIYDTKLREQFISDDHKRCKEYKADTIEGLAKELSIDPRALSGEIHEYNASIDKYGYDTKHGRRYWGGVKGKQQVPKIDTPPFWAIKCKISLTSCKGGLKINSRAQVIDQMGDVIPGLYAAGEVTGGFYGKPDAYYPGGMTAMSFVFGRVAGENAAAESNN